jgi:hypothetical protein
MLKLGKWKKNWLFVSIRQIRLLESNCSWPKVILLSGAHCIILYKYYLFSDFAYVSRNSSTVVWLSGAPCTQCPAVITCRSPITLAPHTEKKSLIAGIHFTMLASHGNWPSLATAPPANLGVAFGLLLVFWEARSPKSEWLRKLKAKLELRSIFIIQSISLKKCF